MRDGFNNLIDYTECIIGKPIGQAAYMFAYSLCVCVYSVGSCTDGNRKPPTPSLTGLPVPCRETLLLNHPVCFHVYMVCWKLVVLQDVHHLMKPYWSSLDFSWLNKLSMPSQLFSPIKGNFGMYNDLLIKVSYTYWSDLLHIFISNQCNILKPF